MLHLFSVPLVARAQEFYEELVKLREEKLFRYLGVTAHNAFEAMYTLIEFLELDFVVQGHGRPLAEVAFQAGFNAAAQLRPFIRPRVAQDQRRHLGGRPVGALGETAEDQSEKRTTQRLRVCFMVVSASYFWNAPRSAEPLSGRSLPSRSVIGLNGSQRPALRAGLPG